jgi:phage gpG-like protein
MVEIQFNVKDEVSPRMIALLEDLKDFTEPLRKAEEYMRGSILETFRAQGRPQKWAPWKHPEQVLLQRLYRHRGGSYARLNEERKAIARQLITKKMGLEEAKEKWKGKMPRWVERLVGGGQILIDTGTLMRSVTRRNPKVGGLRKITKTEVVIGTTVKYAPFHQYGTRYIPPRPFLQILPEDKENITEIFKEWLDKVVGYRGG